MCTLTYFPRSGNEFTITSNRDESPKRPALTPRKLYHHPEWITYPTDIIGSGSWIAHNDSGAVSVLLNGAFSKHKRRPPYGHSRGLLVLKSFGFNSLREMADKYFLKNIEPFTLVRFVPGTDIEEIRWDGENSHYKIFARNKNHIWSSAMLYTQQMQVERESWFEQFLNQNPSPSPDDLWDFHHRGGAHAPKHYRILMEREEVKTLAVMQINFSQSRVKYRYEEVHSQNKLNH
ncbi:MAG: NRDE family protein [Cryomorphaceae bacterium]|nr:NRDE family protein [Cryomorphaceae bacterium]